MSDRPTSSASRLPRIVAGVLVAAAVIAALYWFFGPGDPAAVDAQDAREQAEAAGDAASASDDRESAAASASERASTSAPSSSETASDEASPDAAGPATVWSVDTEVVGYSFADGAGTFVGFRIEEELSSVGQSEAVGRTPEVDGSLTVEGTTVTDARFTGDIRALTTDRSQRDRRARSALGDGEVTFELTEPIELADEPAPGDTITTEATGDLTVNGVTRQETVPLEASLSESGVLVVTSSFPVDLSDHEVEAPSAPIVLSVSDTATVEVQLFLTQGA